MTHRNIFFLVALSLMAAPLFAVETVRIDASAGAPRILVDGKPVRARMFWGSPGSRPIALSAKGGMVSFEFSPKQDEPGHATMHFRFGHKPGDIYLDDIRIVDLQDGHDIAPVSDFEGGQPSFARDWTVWPSNKQNTIATVRVEAGVGQGASAGLHVAIKAPPNGDWPDFHFYHQADLSLRRGHRYRVTFWAKAEPARNVTVAFYRPGATYVFLGGPGGVFENQIKLAGAAGAPFVSFPVEMPWPKPAQAPDFDSADATCQDVLDANPNVLMVPRIGVTAPAWWRLAHPDDVMVWDKGVHRELRAAVASPLFRKEAAGQLAAFVAHLEAKFGPHIAGYHPVGQNTGEWFYQDTWLPGLNGYSKATRIAWRQWLSQRYKDDAALRAAWHDPGVSLAAAEVPSPAQRRAHPAGVLRDPATEQSLIDFAEFQQQMMADCVVDLAHAVRAASGGRKLVLFFFGYVFEFGAVYNGPAVSGHYDLRPLLDCPDIDVICSPISYFDRGLGQSAPAMTPAESIALAGKMYLEEDDTYTYLATGNPPGSRDVVDTLQKTNQELLRNDAQCALRNFGTWWMDLGATGWFNDPGMWAQMKKLAALDDPLLKHSTPFLPQIAAVIDVKSMERVAAGGQTMTGRVVYEARRALGRSGAPYGQYLMDDVLAGKVHARVYAFLAAWRLEPAERRKLLAAAAGAVRLWCYAPGYEEDHATTLDGMRELTGFSCRKITGVDAWAEPTDAGKKLGLTQGFGMKGRMTPLFAATDAKPREVLATYSDGSAAIALRQDKSGVSIFVGPPGLTSELVRLAARLGKAHLFTRSDCNVCANGPYLLLHAAADGPLNIDTGRTSAVRDLLTGQDVGMGPTLKLPIEKGQTRILEIGDK